MLYNKGLVVTDKAKYYFQLNGKKAVSMWIEIDNNWYYFDKRGKSLKGSKRIDSNYYYFNNEGVLQTGIVEEKKNYCRYYSEREGKMLKGWIRKGDKFYFANSKGKLHRGYLNLNNLTYYFKDDYSLKLDTISMNKCG